MRSKLLLLALTLATAVRAAHFELATATVADVNAAFAAGALTSEKLTQLCLARIAAYDQRGPKINAVITINPKALETARALDAERKAGKVRGPLHGVPVLLKDNYNTADLPTSGGARGLAGSLSPTDAFTVQKLREAGAVFVAKVNLSELARTGISVSSLLGQTLNPYDLTRTPGGSSGGTGAGVAASFGILGTGSDTGQSIRSPASANHLVGLRPTFGLISREGIIPISFTQDTAGPIARSVADAAAMMDAIVAFDPLDASTWVGIGKRPKSYLDALSKNGLVKKRIGLVPELFGTEPVHAEVNAATQKAVALLESAGATVVTLSIPEAAYYFKNLREISVSEFESIHGLDAYFRALGPKAKFKTTAEFIADGQIYAPTLALLKRELAKPDALRDPVYARALEKQAGFRDRLIALMEQHQLDALFFPHQRRLVVPAGDAEQVDRNGFMASSTGLPAITFPGGFSAPNAAAPVGVPIGVELLGRPFSEPLLLNMAYAYEQAAPPRTPPASTPPLPGENFNY